jgi:hypothetical protein
VCHTQATLRTASCGVNHHLRLFNTNADIELKNPYCEKGKSGATDSLVEDRKFKISRINFKRRFFQLKDLSGLFIIPVFGLFASTHSFHLGLILLWSFFHYFSYTFHSYWILLISFGCFFRLFDPF